MGCAGALVGGYVIRGSIKGAAAALFRWWAVTGTGGRDFTVRGNLQQALWYLISVQHVHTVLTEVGKQQIDGHGLLSCASSTCSKM